MNRKKYVFLLMIVICLVGIFMYEYKCYNETDLSIFSNDDDGYKEFKSGKSEDMEYTISYKVEKNIVSEVKICYYGKYLLSSGNKKIKLNFSSEAFVVKTFDSKLYDIRGSRRKLIEHNTLPSMSMMGEIEWFEKSNILGTNVNKVEIFLQPRADYTVDDIETLKDTLFIIQE